MFWGLSSNYYISVSKLAFSLDLNYNQVLLKLPTDSCKSENNCEETSKKTKTDKYKGATYDYKPIKTFLSWQKISPAEITSIEQFDYLKLFRLRSLTTDSLSKFMN